MTSKTPATQLPAILANPSTGIVNSKLVKAARRHRTPRTRPRPTRPSSGSTRPPRPAPAAARTRSSRTARRRRSRSSRTRSTGARRRPRSDRRRPQHDRADPADQHPARHARDRDRPLGRPGADAEGQQERARLAAAVDVGLLAVREQRPEDLGGHVEQAVPDRRSATRSTTSRSCSVAGPGAIQAPGVIPSMFLGSLPQNGRDQAGRHQGEGGARRVGRRRARRSRSSTRAT